MPSGYYKVSVNGFRCLAETWDDALNRDGQHDEIRIAVGINYVDKNDAASYRDQRSSPVMGDIQNPAVTVQVGNAAGFWGRKSGGIISGDSFPPDNPWNRAEPFPHPAGAPPFMAWEGELIRNERVVFITPTIWEWDPGEDTFQGWLQWQVDADAKFGQKAKEIVGGIWKVTEPVFDAVSLGIQTVATLQSGGVLGMAGSRPVGFQRDEGSDTFSFNPQVLVLTFDTAEALITHRPSGYGYGVKTFEFKDDSALRGHYELFLQVERIGDVRPDVDLQHDGRLYKADNAPEIYVIFGGAKFWVPDLATLQRLYGTNIISVTPSALQTTPTMPRNGTLLREENRPHVWLIENGARRHVTRGELLDVYGGWPVVRIVPDDAVTAFPIGAPVV